MEDLQLGYILAGIINFGILYFIFKKYLADGLTKLISEKREQMKSLEGAEDVVREKILSAEKNAQKILEEARNKAEEIQKNAEMIAKQTSQKTIQNAEDKAKNILESAQREIEKEEKALWERLKNKVLDVSLKVNTKLFQDANKNAEFLEKEINSIKM